MSRGSPRMTSSLNWSKRFSAAHPQPKLRLGQQLAGPLVLWVSGKAKANNLPPFTKRMKPAAAHQPSISRGARRIHPPSLAGVVRRLDSRLCSLESPRSLDYGTTAPTLAPATGPSTTMPTRSFQVPLFSPLLTNLIPLSIADPIPSQGFALVTAQPAPAQ